MKRSLALATSILFGVLTAGSSHAQEFPTKQPIKIVVPVPPGGGTDTLARIGAEFLQRRLKQAVVVENRPGASSTIGVNYITKSKPDGYTLLFMGAELPVVPAVRNDLPYSLDDLTYLVRSFRSPQLVLASPKLPFNTVGELVKHMKENPGKIRYGTTGVGAIVHLGMAMFEQAAGVKGTHVPYQGGGPIYVDMLAGNVDITEGSPPFLEGVKVIGTAGKERHPAYPDARTLEEDGIEGANWDIWFGLFAPANLPKPIADRITAEWTAVLKDPEAIAKFATAKYSPEKNPLTGEDFKKSVLDDLGRWKTVVEQNHITIQQ